jgi:pimeloyl-ACP methyl ester carboxylesterase
VRTAGRPGLFLTDRGTGEPVLLITGWTVSSAVFEPVAHLYVPDVRVLAYDHRGTGRSGHWPLPVSMAMLAADAARVLDDRGVRCAHVVGLSLGAAVALELAVRMPDRVRSLVLVGGAAGGPTTVLPAPGDALGAAAGVVRDSVRRGTLWPAATLFSGAFRDEHPDRVAAYVPYFARHRAPPWAAGWQTLAAACFAGRASLHRVRAPTLIVHGGRDVMTPPGNARLLADGIPGAELHVFEGAGHAVPLERAAECAELLLGWTRRHAGREPARRSGQEVVRERLTRPLALHAGALRNARDAVRPR